MIIITYVNKNLKKYTFDTNFYKLFKKCKNFIHLTNGIVNQYYMEYIRHDYYYNVYYYDIGLKNIYYYNHLNKLHRIDGPASILYCTNGIVYIKNYIINNIMYSSLEKYLKICEKNKKYL